MAKSKLVEANKKIEEAVVGGYKKIEDGVVGGYKKIENGVVGGFNKMSDKFVDNYLTSDGESVEEAKKRLSADYKAREVKSKKEIEERNQQQQDIIKENKSKVELHRL